jgi:aldose 1-dehydrogenase [NAD(P)+]
MGRKLKAIIVFPPKAEVKISEIDEINKLDEDKVLVRVLENGICGTDREIVNGRLIFSKPPEGKDWMILGHEAIGVIERVGSKVDSLEEGEFVMPINRRGCGRCLNCLVGRADHCETGDYLENGIKGLDGFMVEYFQDSPRYLVRVPKNILDIAILAQPLSDLVKSVEEIIHIQKRSIWTCNDGTYSCRKALVIGTGPIGILTSILLKTYNFNVFISNRRDPNSIEEYIFKEVKINYYNSVNGYEDLKRDYGTFDLVFDTTGRAEVIHIILDIIGYNGILALFGFSNIGSINFNSGDFERIVQRSIVIVGLINGQKPHFEKAITLLSSWKNNYPSLFSKLITKEIDVEDEESVMDALKEKKSGEIKIKIRWKK